MNSTSLPLFFSADWLNYAFAAFFFIGFLFEGLSLFFANTHYLKYLPTIVKFSAGMNFKTGPLDSAAKNQLRDIVTKQSFQEDGKALWICMAQSGAFFMIGWRGAVLPTKWNLSENGRRVDSIEIKMPWMSLVMWTWLLIFVWRYQEPVIGFIVTGACLLAYVLSWANLQIVNNTELKLLTKHLLEWPKK